MKKFKVGDLVTIFKQPDDHCVWLEGEFGEIEEIKEEHAFINTYRVDNSPGGRGWVGLKFLKIETNPDKLAARDKDKQRQCIFVAKMEERQTNINDGMKILSEKYNIPVDLLSKIADDVSFLYEYEKIKT